jgi:hypothetical protein
MEPSVYAGLLFVSLLMLGGVRLLMFCQGMAYQTRKERFSNPMQNKMDKAISIAHRASRTTDRLASEYSVPVRSVAQLS